MRLLLLLLALVPPAAVGQVSVDAAWARATAPGSKVAAGYMTIRNAGAAPDRLMAASTPAASRVEMHVTSKDGEIARMREVRNYTVPAKGAFELKPNGPHLMIVNLKAPLTAGGKLPLTLKFEKAGEVKAELQVRPLTAAGPAHNH